MALFKRIVPLHEAISVIRGVLDQQATLPVDLQELSESLKRREGNRAALPAEPASSSVIEAFPEPAGLVEQGCRFMAANAALETLLAGRAAGYTVLHATRSDELNELVSKAVAGWRDQRELTLPALENRVVLATASPLPGSRALLVLRDLSTQKRADAMRRDFIANASHELRTPVAAIAGAAETLLSMPGDEASLPFLEMIARQTARLSRLTNDLLDLSRLESGQWLLEVGAYEALFVCNAALELVRERAALKHIHLGLDAPPSALVRCDARALEQMLVNLLDNAIKYTPQGGRVTLLADVAGAQVIFSVLDTGPGVEARHQQRIFERFYRVDGGRARADGGSGLGLAIVKHLAQAQGGEVGLESGRGGSRFFVKLPAAS